ncbi:GAF domain-containing protein [Plantactinospora sp. WMMB334]|uniref:GAF domain-containing protein n=1 Tax=Plantactinospora sp. WMMB334 TaxID=3404119 RepID=UPI003B93E7F9
MHDTSYETGSASAVDGGSLPAELLQSVVDVARAIFGAQASSVFLLDEPAHALVFQAVSGRGEGFLVGRRFPASEGIAGWVVASGDAMVVNDLSRNATFARQLAETTRYVPDSLMAAPLVHGGRVLGVLEVLDPAPQSRSSLPELELLSLFARQAAAALRVVMESMPARPATPPAGLDPAGREAALHLVRCLQGMLDQPAPAVTG